MTGAVATGSKVVYQDGIYTVRAVDGAVLELAYHTGRFFRLVHISSVIPACAPGLLPEGACTASTSAASCAR